MKPSNSTPSKTYEPSSVATLARAWITAVWQRQLQRIQQKRLSWKSRRAHFASRTRRQLRSGLFPQLAVIDCLEDRTLLSSAPIFSPDNYTFNVSEDASYGTSIGNLSVTDPDGDLMILSITSGDELGRFAIDTDGQLTLQSQLNHEAMSSYTLSVEAIDFAFNMANAAVIIDHFDTDVKSAVVCLPTDGVAHFARAASSPRRSWMETPDNSPRAAVADGLRRSWNSSVSRSRSWRQRSRKHDGAASDRPGRLTVHAPVCGRLRRGSESSAAFQPTGHHHEHT
ncbi:MAG: hypothetical protein CMJ78_22975 [Planctomycetaceae bacterium]|nr:hypothetical protein [Planctomycetaceae bacterium]